MLKQELCRFLPKSDRFCKKYEAFNLVETHSKILEIELLVLGHNQ